MSTNRTFTRTFVGHAEQLDAIREFVVRAVRALGGDEDDLWACELAADEAAANAFEHAYEGKGGRVKVTVWHENNDLLMSVTNWGKTFDPDEVAMPDIRLPLELRPEGGLGLYMIRRVMSQVWFDFDPRHGNTITMQRGLHSHG